MTIDFQNHLKQIAFTTFHQRQLETFAFDDLFNDRRVIVFSITQIYTRTSLARLESFDSAVESFKSYGIDNIYAIDSTDWTIGPWVDRRAKNVIGLPDRDMKFVEYVADYAKVSKTINELAQMWQYTIIVNNGIPEKIWHNPFKSDMALTLIKDPRYRYRGVGVDHVEKYLIDNPK